MCARDLRFSEAADGQPNSIPKPQPCSSVAGLVDRVLVQSAGGDRVFQSVPLGVCSETQIGQLLTTDLVRLVLLPQKATKSFCASLCTDFGSPVH